ncbi:hypothetical protein A3D88_00920 [Candidatus Peribacteria bacterium RIFCSPHIGHO2_02_FULL_52_16]|nr:MAG: hypothetical protein A2706_05565 [Candidatus Peribacteria bacterium RIFCSPHIGHO2_01_FULL_51_35]OGJ61228.1 MAG: hypothetical protein A3D88_00920 [Candidatus Peribacteria bacterium RIFCSPHIGHO2_02_FULL_52_16]
MSHPELGLNGDPTGLRRQTEDLLHFISDAKELRKRKDPKASAACKDAVHLVQWTLTPEERTVMGENLRKQLVEEQKRYFKMRCCALIMNIGHFISLGKMENATTQEREIDARIASIIELLNILEFCEFERRQVGTRN